MSQTPRKRDRKQEALVDSIDDSEPKRFHREETDRFQLHLLQLDKTLSDDAEEDCAPSEELVNGVMKCLEEEIFAATCSTSYNPSYAADNSAATDIPGVYEGQTRDSDLGSVDLCYLLEASDDELGIPPSPALDVKGDVCQSPKVTSDGLSESSGLKSLT